MIALSGVRSSWLIVARNCDLAILACSAVARAAPVATRERAIPRAPSIEAPMPAKNARSATVSRKRSLVAASTSPATRCGCWRHTRWATTPPIE